jgi:arylformamidase
MTLLTGKRVVDLTRVLWPGKERFKLNVHTYSVDELLPDFPVPEGQWYILQEWEVSSHIGTHVESPYHHVKDGTDVAGLSMERVMGEAVVLDFRHKRAGEAIERDEIEDAGSDVRAGDIVLVHTGFDRLYGDPNYDRPHLSLDAVRWLVEREIACLGIDASGIEKYKAAEQPGHLLLFARGIPVIEELTHLEQLRQSRVFFIGLPLPIQGADSCPIRAIAIEEA